MNDIKISDDIIPIGKFKTSLSKWFKKVQTNGNPLIITQNGKPAGVLLSPADYDALVHTKRLINSVNRGLGDVESGHVLSTDELKEVLAQRRALRKSQ